MKAFIAMIGLAALAAGCGKDLDGTQTTTDHYVERIGRGERVGDLSVTAVSEGDKVTVRFAAPAADWKDPRPQRIAAGAPTARIAAGCTLSAKREDGGKATLAAQSCSIAGGTLEVERGFVWVQEKVLNVNVSGKLGGESYTLQYPYGVVEPALKLP